MNIQSAITQGAQILKDKFFLNPYLGFRNFNVKSN